MSERVSDRVTDKEKGRNQLVQGQETTFSPIQFNITVEGRYLIHIPLIITNHILSYKMIVCTIKVIG